MKKKVHFWARNCKSNKYGLKLNYVKPYSNWGGQSIPTNCYWHHQCFSPCSISALHRNILLKWRHLAHQIAKRRDSTLFFCNSLCQAEEHIEKCKKVLSIVNQISLLGRGYRTLNSIPFKKELRIYYYNQGKKTQVEIQGYHH